MDKKNNYTTPFDFFQNDRFIQWRMIRSKELDAYWMIFLEKYPQYKNLLEESIEKFEAVQLNRNYLSGERKTNIYSEILDRINAYEQRKRKQKIIYWSSIAASVMLLIVSVWWITSQTNSPSQITQNQIIGRAMPSKEIQLISENGSTTLKPNTIITLTTEGKATVQDSTPHIKSVELSKTKLNKLIVPYGKRIFIMLADGTKVWLNSGTELDFPSNFTQYSRNIFVKGEIFIDVAYAKNKPFIVHTHTLDIQVYGTQFNVMSYDEEPIESVVLVEGSVQVKNKQSLKKIELKPNELLESQNNAMHTKRVNVNEYISWKKGVLEFNQTSTMADVLKKISRYYNVQFDMSNSSDLFGKTCSGKLYLSNSLDSVMISMSALTSTEYNRNKNVITIRNKH